MAAAAVEASAQESAGVAQAPADTVPDSEASVVLDDYVVTARRKLVTVDAEKVSYEASEDPDAQSLSALDMLRRVPMVSVDGQDNITVNGKSDFRIYVDGKPNPMLSSNPGQLLKTIPAGQIARFEVITSPGANYDAEGVGGILNIVLKSAGNMDGYTATLTATAGDRMQSGNIYAMLQKKKVSLSANASVMHYDIPQIDGDVEHRDTSGGSVLQQHGVIDNQFNGFNGGFSFDWKPDDANTFSLSGSFNRSPFRSYTSALVETFASPDAPAQGYAMRSRLRTRQTGIGAGADYTHIFGSEGRHKLQLAYRLNLNPTRSVADNYFFPANDSPVGVVPPDYSTADRTGMTENIGQADYTLPVGDKHTFSAGSKITFRRSSSDASGLDYVHHSTIAAGYVNYALAAGGLSLNAGARYEHTHQSARYADGSRDPYSADYNNFVPSLTLNYSFTPVRSLSASYNIRISRPGIYMLNPYIDTSNPIEVSTGNPRLHPEKYSNFTAAWSAMWGKVMFNARAGYSFTNDGITQITAPGEGGITYKTYSNSLRSRQATLSLFVSYTPWTPTRINLNATTTYSALRSPLAGVSNHGWSATYSAGVQQTLPWKLQLSANLYGSSGYQALQASSDAMVMYMFSLSRSFVSDRLNVSLTAMNPFTGSTSVSVREWGPDMLNTTQVRMNLRSVTLSVSYRLGDLKPRNTTPRELDSDLARPASDNMQQGMPGGVM